MISDTQGCKGPGPRILVHSICETMYLPKMGQEVAVPGSIGHSSCNLRQA